MEKPVILCIDDEKSVLNALRDEIKFELGNDFSIEIADNGEEGLALVQEFLAANIQIPVVISDQLMPGMKGDEFLTHVYQIAPTTRTILLTGQATAEAVGNAVNNARLYRFISKPWDAKDLMMTIQQAARSYFIDAELSARIETLNEINKTTSSIAKEIHPDTLQKQILTETILYSGVDKGVLLICNPEYTEEEGEDVTSLSILYAVEGVRNENNEITFSKIPINDQTDLSNQLASYLPFSILNRIFETHRFFVSDRIMRDPNFSNDPYLVAKKNNRINVRSILAMPILKDDFGSLLGAIYLESEKKSGLFQEMQLEYFTLILRQAAVSLDNSFLYQNLEQRVNQRTTELNEQKELLAQKNQDFVDSIRYALRIQKALLPDLDYFQAVFPDSFVFYKPKDIVSGDFYWLAKVEHYFYIAAVDCTGHGVPGAFMSILGNSLLNELISQNKILEVADVLTQLHKGVMLNLDRSKHGDPLLDGMDIALCRICTITKTIQFAGANRSLIIIRAGQVIETYTNKTSIGYTVSLNGQISEKVFSQETISYQSNDQIYIFTDGVTDQFGGDNNRKLSKKAFINFLLTLEEVPFSEKEDAVKLFLEKWQGDYEQTDDMLLIGAQIP